MRKGFTGVCFSFTDEKTMRYVRCSQSVPRMSTSSDPIGAKLFFRISRSAVNQSSTSCYYIIIGIHLGVILQLLSDCDDQETSVDYIPSLGVKTRLHSYFITYLQSAKSVELVCT